MTILLMLLLIWLGWQILKISFRIIFWLVIIALIAAVVLVVENKKTKK